MYRDHEFRKYLSMRPKTVMPSFNDCLTEILPKWVNLTSCFPSLNLVLLQVTNREPCSAHLLINRLDLYNISLWNINFYNSLSKSYFMIFELASFSMSGRFFTFQPQNNLISKWWCVRSGWSMHVVMNYLIDSSFSYLQYHIKFELLHVQKYVS